MSPLLYAFEACIDFMLLKHALIFSVSTLTIERVTTKIIKTELHNKINGCLSDTIVTYFVYD